jgi:adenine-specific DNA methylase
MSQPFRKTKPSFLEAGLPCASLSAESQRDNNARQRPPQNRLHIWWARRPPTICRAAILAGLLPYDLDLDEAVLPPVVNEPSVEDLEDLPPKLRPHRAFFERLLTEVAPTQLTPTHQDFIRAMGIRGDTAAAYQRITLANDYHVNGRAIQMPVQWSYRHSPAFVESPSSTLIDALISRMRTLCGLAQDERVVLLDPMAGGGSIPLEGLRYGMKVYANELNPVAALVLKATLEYPARHGRAILPILHRLSEEVADRVGQRLACYFHHDLPNEWWPECEAEVHSKFTARAILEREPGGNERIQATLWLRRIPCVNCHLNVPLSTNFLLVTKKGKPNASIAAFPIVPERQNGNDCTFRIVSRAEWKDCVWPRPGFERWDPRGTPTFKDGKALCPRCGHVMDGDEVKAIARSREGGLATQMYAVCSQVPVNLTYRNGDVKVRYLWRFRAPTQQDLDAAGAAEVELAQLRPRWEALDLIPTEDVPEEMEDKRPREYGMPRWQDLFLPRQLLTNVVILEEILAAQSRARAELPERDAEAVSVYLSLFLSKIVSYNSVQTSWDDGRLKTRGSFPGHDFRFHSSFGEIEASRETVMWGASQVLNSYEELARLIHGEPVTLVEGDDDEEDVPEDEEAEEAESADEDEVETKDKAASAIDNSAVHLRPDVIVPTITCNDAAALSEPAAGTVHLLCVDPPYYNNVQYSELSNFFYVWLKRTLRDWPGLVQLFQEPLADANREAVANVSRWQRQAEAELAAWQARYDAAYEDLCSRKMKAREAKVLAAKVAGSKPPTVKERADRFYEDKMAACFRRARQLLHPAGRMVVMFIRSILFVIGLWHTTETGWLVTPAGVAKCGMQL